MSFGPHFQMGNSIPAITLVTGQTAVASVAGGPTTITATFPNFPVATNTVFAFVYGDQNGLGSVTVKSGATSFTLDCSVSDGGAVTCVGIYRLTGITAKAVDLSNLAGNGYNLVIAEFTGILSASPTDGGNTNSGTTGTALTHASYTPAVSGDLQFACLNCTGDPITATPAGFTLIDNTATANFARATDTRYRVQSVAAATNASWTQTSSSNWSAAGQAYKNG